MLARAAGFVLVLLLVVLALFLSLGDKKCISIWGSRSGGNFESVALKGDTPKVESVAPKVDTPKVDTSKVDTRFSTGCGSIVNENHKSFVTNVRSTVRARGYAMFQSGDWLRLQNVQDLAFDVIARNVPGDFVETGVWKGGASMASRAAALITGTQNCHNNWLFDSYEGLPVFKKEDIAADTGKKMDPPGSYAFAGGVETVKRNFEETFPSNLSSPDSIHFVKGWFNDTVPVAPVEKIAILRLDGDMYTSTMDVLHAMYHKVVPSGFVIIDDYGAWPQCKKAIHDFFDGKLHMDIATRLKIIDETGVYFQVPFN